MIAMNFYTVGDLRNSSKSIWNHLSSDEEVVITSNGKPKALMINVSDENFEDTIKAIRQVRAIIAFNSMRQKVSEEGYMTDQEIEAEIKAARQGT